MARRRRWRRRWPPRATATEKILARSVGFGAALRRAAAASLPRPPPSMSSITRGRTSGLSNFDGGKVRQKVDSVMMTMTNEVSGDHRRSNVREGTERKAGGRKEGRKERAPLIIIASLRIRLRTKGTDRPTDRPTGQVGGGSGGGGRGARQRESARGEG